MVQWVVIGWLLMFVLMVALPLKAYGQAIYGMDSTWKGEYQTATQKGEDHWSAEIAIPWATLEVSAPKPGGRLQRQPAPLDPPTAHNRCDRVQRMDGDAIQPGRGVRELRDVGV